MERLAFAGYAASGGGELPGGDACRLLRIGPHQHLDPGKMEALIDIRKGNVTSEQPVEVRMLQGTLNANRLDILDSGDLVRFHGGVVMDMKLSQSPSQEKSNSQ